MMKIRYSVFPCSPSVISPRGTWLRFEYQIHWGSRVCCKMFKTLCLSISLFLKQILLVFRPVKIRSSVKVVPIVWRLLLIGCPDCAVMHRVEWEPVWGRAGDVQFLTSNVLPWFIFAFMLISKFFCNLPIRWADCILRNMIPHDLEHLAHHGAVHPGI